MRTYEFFITQFESGRSHHSRNHQFWPPEEVLIVWTSFTTESNHEGRLASPSSAATPLSIVCWSRRHISHMDDIQVANIDAQLHCGRTKQGRKVPFLNFSSLASRRSGGIWPVWAPPSIPAIIRAVTLYRAAKNAFPFRSSASSFWVRIHRVRIGSACGGVPVPCFHRNEDACNWMAGFFVCVFVSNMKFPLSTFTSAWINCSHSLARCPLACSRYGANAESANV